MSVESWQFLIGFILLLASFSFVEIGVRKWLGAGKYRRKRVNYTDSHAFWSIFFLVAFMIFGIFFGGFVEPYIYFFITAYAIIQFGFDAMMAKKYDEDPKEYKVIMINGSFSCGLLLVFIAVGNHLL